MSNLVKQKIRQKDFVLEDFTDTTHKAMQSLKALMKLLLLKSQWKRIKERFISEKDDSGQQCLKLLLRVKKMYDAKALMVRIIRLVIKREGMNIKVNETSTDDDKQ